MKQSVLLNMGVMGVPVGLVVAFEALRQGDSLLWTITGLIGILVLFIGLAIIYKLFRDAKREDLEKEIKQRTRDKILAEMLSQLAGLRQDFTQWKDKDGRNKDS